MTTRARWAVAPLATLAAVLLASCGATASFPDRVPDAVGTLGSLAHPETWSIAPGTAIFVLAIEGDEYAYYSDAVLYFDEDTVIGNQSGEALGVGDISAGLAVEVWTDACQESFPVQCGVTHVRVTPAD